MVFSAATHSVRSSRSSLLVLRWWQAPRRVRHRRRSRPGCVRSVSFASNTPVYIASLARPPNQLAFESFPPASRLQTPGAPALDRGRSQTAARRNPQKRSNPVSGVGGDRPGLTPAGRSRIAEGIAPHVGEIGHPHFRKIAPRIHGTCWFSGVF